mmetsp:Transcript_20499/g.52040  ORF Transcript_20499/g.52040 Transcript_20499/m.52040 type:complete len:234 (+) Transcript_20499:38-739(+)
MRRAPSTTQALTRAPAGIGEGARQSTARHEGVRATAASHPGELWPAAATPTRSSTDMSSPSCWWGGLIARQAAACGSEGRSATRREANTTSRPSGPTADRVACSEGHLATMVAGSRKVAKPESSSQWKELNSCLTDPSCFFEPIDSGLSLSAMSSGFTACRSSRELPPASSLSESSTSSERGACIVSSQLKSAPCRPPAVRSSASISARACSGVPSLSRWASASGPPIRRHSQ